MSDKLMIEQLTDNLEMEKKAEEAEMEKMAQVVNVVDQAQTLTSVGEDMFKIAEALGDESLAALAVDTYQLGERMGSSLVKMASENEDTLSDTFEIAEDMHKLASVYADLADETGDDTLVKMAEAMIPIANEMVEEVNEVMEGIEKEAGVADKAKSLGKLLSGKKAYDLAAGMQDIQKRTGGGDISKLKGLIQAIKANPKSNLSAVLAPVGTAAALAGAGYGAKKALSKKD